ncbi:MAG: mucoidy inhibitor MuiA family protein, partial [Bacteroidales bacterium]|nr:mucoidy inhibitor MuiA family protein [Bacteroidales bacterium]
GEILSVKHELVNQQDKSKEALEFEEKIIQLKEKLDGIDNEISVYDIEEKMLLDNSVFNKKGDGSTIAEIKEASDFYRARLNEIKKNKQKLKIESESIKKEIGVLFDALSKRVKEDSKSYSKVSFIVKSDEAINKSFRLSYYVSSAGWKPLYDFRVNGLKDPLNLVYNANIFQSTAEDWPNVNITLSTDRPSLSNIKPDLDTWFVDKKVPVNKKKFIADGIGTLMGRVEDSETREPIPFANVLVMKDGVTVTGVTTDSDGKYIIRPIPSGCYDVKATFVGYEPMEIKNVEVKPDKISFQDIYLISTSVPLNEYVVVEYCMPVNSKENTYPRDTQPREEIAKMSGRSAESIAIVVGGVNNQKTGEVIFIGGYESNTNITSLEYKIDVPYSIPSDGNEYGVKIQEVKVPVNYVYSCVPKLDNDIFLIAEMTNWAKLNLLSGQSSIYYNGIFTGQSEIDAQSMKDTLSISLNRDKNIIVERTLLKEKNQKQFIGKNTVETFSWSITVRNNKREKVKIFVEDQFPKSENSSVSIEKLDYSNGKLDKKSDKVTWEIELEPDEKKELILKYSVKYPSSMKVYLE